MCARARSETARRWDRLKRNVPPFVKSNTKSDRSPDMFQRIEVVQPAIEFRRPLGFSIS
jgi:hypothetical protein